MSIAIRYRIRKRRCKGSQKIYAMETSDIFRIFWQTSIEEGTDENSEQRAKELLVKLAEYKPLAKVEEMEEQNYNMIDNVLNNGVEKFNRKEDKQKLQQGRTSLKERLCTKQCEVFGKTSQRSAGQNKLKRIAGRCVQLVWLLM